MAKKDYPYAGDYAQADGVDEEGPLGHFIAVKSYNAIIGIVTNGTLFLTNAPTSVTSAKHVNMAEDYWKPCVRVSGDELKARLLAWNEYPEANAARVLKALGCGDNGPRLPKLEGLPLPQAGDFCQDEGWADLYATLLAIRQGEAIPPDGFGYCPQKSRRRKRRSAW
jgi:hypothetical protein